MTTTAAGAAAPAEVEAAVADLSLKENNPLLALDEPFPLFDRVMPEHVVPGMKTLLDELNAQVTTLEEEVKPTWAGLIEPLERISDRNQRAWGVVSHLKGVKDSEGLRKAVEEIQPLIVKFGSRLAQSKPLYEAFKALKADSAAWEALSDPQRRIVETELRDFVLGGVALEGKEKERFNEIAQELAQLSTKFGNNVLDSTKAFKKLVMSSDEVAGLPASALALAAQQAAKEPGHDKATPEEGPWLFTLDFPSYMPVVTHCKNRVLREELYRAYITRASKGEVDNGPIIEKILGLKREKAQLLGFDTFAELAMQKKMANLDTAEALLEELRSASVTAAKKDLEEVKEFAKTQGFNEELLWWDIPFWAERLREARYDINEEALRPYFALPSVLKGLFGVAQRLFGVEVKGADGLAPVWHPDVKFFELLREGKHAAYFYLDPYSRPAEKRGGAWMAEVAGRSKLLSQQPIAHMVCNQSPPIGDKPSLMTFREVETLFHEFGHALQHMLTEVDEGMVSGIRGVEWDAVELPSQFMENWCYDRKTLYSFAKHFETGDPLPEDLYQKLKAAKTYRSGSMMLRQIQFSSIDLELHARFIPGNGESVFDRDRKVSERTAVLPPFPEDRFLCSFSHIFAGGYSAGYYSYKWAEVLSADAFSAFEEVGLDKEDKVEETGRRFRDTVLSLGGSVAPSEVFKSFRGRAPSTQALLRHNDLVVVAAAAAAP